MKKLFFVFGLSLASFGFFSVQSAHAAIRWADFFENAQASMINYGSARDTEVKKNIRPRLTSRSNTDNAIDTSKLFGPEKNKKIGLGSRREIPLQKMMRYDLMPERPIRRVSNLGLGASSYKQQVRNDRGRDNTRLKDSAQSYLQRKTNAFRPLRNSSETPQE